MLPGVAGRAPPESTEAELGLEALDEKLSAHGINTKLFGKQAGSRHTQCNRRTGYAL